MEFKDDPGNGVVWIESRQQWRAQLSMGEGAILLGFFDTYEDGLATYQSFLRTIYGEYLGN